MPGRRSRTTRSASILTISPRSWCSRAAAWAAAGLAGCGPRASGRCCPRVGRLGDRRSVVLAVAGGGEEVDEQLVDALGLVVVDPVRRAGQALDAVEVGDVLSVGLGELGAEVAIALPPDHQGRRRDGAK